MRLYNDFIVQTLRDTPKRKWRGGAFAKQFSWSGSDILNSGLLVRDLRTKVRQRGMSRVRNDLLI